MAQLDTGNIDNGADKVKLARSNIKSIADWINGLMGYVANPLTAGEKTAVRASMDAAAKGVNSDITSLSAVTAITGLESINGGPVGCFRNRLINPDFAVCQRTASGTPVSIPNSSTTRTYVADRWAVTQVGASSMTASWGNTILGSSDLRGYLSAEGAAGNTSVTFSQRIERQNCVDFLSGVISLSVRMHTDLVMNVSWELRNAGAVDGFTTSAVLASGTFTSVSGVTTRTVTSSLAAHTEILGLELRLIFPNVTSGRVLLYKVQLELGSTPTAFEQRPYGLELDLCRRYYRRMLTPASNGRVAIGFAWQASAAQFNMECNWFDQMRTVPALSWADVSQWVVNDMVTPIPVIDFSAVAFPNSVTIAIYVTSGLSAGRVLFLEPKSAGSGGTGVFLTFNAEL